MTPTEFLATIWGPNPPGLVQLWSAKTRKSSYLHDTTSLPVDVDLTDLYMGVGLSPTAYRANQRCKAHDIAGIAGLWLDVDIAPDKCPTELAAHQIASAICEPTLIVNSGGGLHVWHLLEQPFAITDPETRSKFAILADAWVTCHQQAATANGWRIDAVKDLARLLRVPGTLNGKTQPPRPVDTVVTDGPRYTAAQLNELVKREVPAAMARHRMRTSQPTIQVGAINTTMPPTIDGQMLADIIDLVPEFAATWRRERPDLKNDQSAYDMSLAHWTLEAGWPDQAIVDLLRHHRLRHNPTDPKASRADYYARTLANARRDQDKHARQAEQRDRLTRIRALRDNQAA